jgi:hypothetical protein
MDGKLRANEIIAYFKDKPFKADELYQFYTDEEPELKETTFRWRVYALKNNGIINTIKKGVYATEHKNDFEPEITRSLARLFSRVKKNFPYADMAIWETSWLKNHMLHQTIGSDTILEIERDVAPAVFAYLQKSQKDVYLNPGQLEMENYIMPGRSNIIVKNLTVTSPLIERDGVIAPRIEKVMIDLFVEKDLFLTYQGAELQNMYREFFETYNINRSTLGQYANKRHVKKRFITFLKKKANIHEEDLLM